MTLLSRLEQLAIKYPNDMMFGEAVRQLVYKLHTDTQTIEEWKISQFNRNRAQEDQVSTIEELEQKVSEIFGD